MEHVDLDDAVVKWLGKKIAAERALIEWYLTIRLSEEHNSPRSTTSDLYNSLAYCLHNGDMHAAETAVSGLQNVLNYITKHSTALIQLMDERSKMLSLEDQERIFEEEQKWHKNNGYSWLTE